MKKKNLFTKFGLQGQERTKYFKLVVSWKIMMNVQLGTLLKTDLNIIKQTLNVNIIELTIQSFFDS